MSADFPTWFTTLAWASLALALTCAVITAVDLARRPQPMAVMNVVYPVVMLFGSVVWLWFYLTRQRAPRRGHDAGGHAGVHGERHGSWVSTATGTSHCGAGCAMGDVIAEFTVAAFPALAVWVGWGSLYDNEMYAAWIWDLVLAFAIGIALQYFAIAPMREQSRGRSLRDAIKADTFSILAWQVGMYGVMAIAQLALLPALFGGPADVTGPEFWFVMQFAMVAGFACSYPVNARLIAVGIKEAM